MNEMMDDPFGYRGRRVVVTGAASGMGAACAAILSDLGAEVHGLDIKDPPAALQGFHRVDLADPDQIDAAVAAIGGPLHGLFCCAGLPTTADDLDIVLVNFAGHRQLTEVAIPLMAEGSAVGLISSAAGMGWMMSTEKLMALLATPDLPAVRRWCEDNPEAVGGDGYRFSKEALCAYAAWRDYQLAGQGIRVNTLNPGPTDTPMMPEFVASMGEDYFASFPRPIGRNSRPDEQAWVLVFLNSPRASYVTATSVFADGGFSGGILTGQVDVAAQMPR
jgi:NAD(P)-dependent dehydrogenase (short-subunit alcohol dehydrogenase family)